MKNTEEPGLPTTSTVSVITVAEQGSYLCKNTPIETIPWLQHQRIPAPASNVTKNKKCKISEMTTLKNMNVYSVLHPYILEKANGIFWQPMQWHFFTDVNGPLSSRLSDRHVINTLHGTVVLNVMFSGENDHWKLAGSWGNKKCLTRRLLLGKPRPQRWNQTELKMVRSFPALCRSDALTYHKSRWLGISTKLYNSTQITMNDPQNWTRPTSKKTDSSNC